MVGVHRGGRVDTSESGVRMEAIIRWMRERGMQAAVIREDLEKCVQIGSTSAHEAAFDELPLLTRLRYEREAAQRLQRRAAGVAIRGCC